MGCAASVQVGHANDGPGKAPGSAQAAPQSPEAAASSEAAAGDDAAALSASKRNVKAAADSRRLSIAGGPAGTQNISAGTDARRRRLSVAVTTGTAARSVAEENKQAQVIVDPNNDPNMPVIRCAESASLPVRWCEYSRPGNDPLKRVKENQDSCVVTDHFADRSEQMFIAVCDGHGPNGQAASQFVRARLPETWAGPDLERDPFMAMNRGCIVTNQELAMSAIDVYVSGTTAVTSLLRGNHLYVANVGDSRAVLARRNAAGEVKALDLSNDQKPDRPDEMARISSCGGRVFEWGVPRVWLKDVDMPGLAMSRSFGDIAAETVGVYAEPELSEVQLGRNDRFILWATDGVWEFISSQDAVDIVAAFREAGTPLEAAAALVKEATRRWTEEEDVIDDTTVIVAFLDYE